jgi:hypothetical protein
MEFHSALMKDLSREYFDNAKFMVTPRVPVPALWVKNNLWGGASSVLPLDSDERLIKLVDHKRASRKDVLKMKSKFRAGYQQSCALRQLRDRSKKRLRRLEALDDHDKVLPPKKAFEKAMIAHDKERKKMAFLQLKKIDGLFLKMECRMNRVLEQVLKQYKLGEAAREDLKLVTS